MLASDENNPEFIGANNPDNRLTVEFYSRPIRNDFKSKETGEPVYDEVDFVRIFVPGDSTNVIDTAAADHHKERFPLHWARYINKVTGPGGTPLEDWPELDSNQIEGLRSAKFRNVEAIANASDGHLQNMGMLGGMAPWSLREKAQNFLKQKGLARADVSAEMQSLRDQNAALQAQMQQLMEMMQGQEQKRGPGRPRNEERTAA